MLPEMNSSHRLTKILESFVGIQMLTILSKSHRKYDLKQDPICPLSLFKSIWRHMSPFDLHRDQAIALHEEIVLKDWLNFFLGQNFLS